MARGGQAFAVLVFSLVAYVAWSALSTDPVPTEAEIKAEGLLIFKLPDGRILEYFDSAPDAKTAPVLLAMHGGFTSSILYKGMADQPAYAGLRLISPTFPGFGGSSSHNGAPLSAFANDVRLLLDSLGVQRFMLLGPSWGGAWALAVAQAMPERVQALALMAPAIPALPDFAGWTNLVRDTGAYFAQRYLLATPHLNRAATRLLFRRILSAPFSRAKLEQILGNDAPGSLFSQPEPVLRAVDAAFRHSLKWNADAQCDLAELALRPELHFDLAAIGKALAAVPVYVWSGANDTVVVRAGHDHVVASFTRAGHPAVKSHFEPNEGHMYCLVAASSLVQQLRKDLGHKM